MIARQKWELITATFFYPQYLMSTSLTEVVEEDVTTEEESSPEVSSSDVSYNFPSPQTKVRDPLPLSESVL